MKKAMNIICIAFILWILLSWADVLLHNDPLNGDMQYSPFNSFVLLGKLGEVIYGE